jgi:predicted amidohydrolase YtcJ
LPELLHLLCGKHFAWARCSDRITIDRALVELGREVERAAGEVEHVRGTLTATESATNVVVERDVCEPVQSSVVMTQV